MLRLRWPDLPAETIPATQAEVIPVTAEVIRGIPAAVIRGAAIPIITPRLTTHRRMAEEVNIALEASKDRCTTLKSRLIQIAGCIPVRLSGCDDSR